MKTKQFFIGIIGLLVSVSAMAGTVNWNGKIVTVENRSQDLDDAKYSVPSEERTIQEFCKTIEQPNINWGKEGRLVCRDLEDGVVEIRGYNASGSLSILANGTDKMLFEYMGDTVEIHRYLNNLNHKLVVSFELRNVSVKKEFWADAHLFSDGRHLRVGNYINE